MISYQVMMDDTLIRLVDHLTMLINKTQPEIGALTGTYVNYL